MPFPANPTILAVCLAIPCLTASTRAETYDARVDGPQILTPLSGPVPAINGAVVYGVRPGSPVIYRIPTTGSRPIRFTAKDLPDSQLNLCQYGMAEVWKWGAETGQSWRVGGDLGHTIMKNGVYEIARRTIKIRGHNGPSSWNDPWALQRFSLMLGVISQWLSSSARFH